MQSVFFNRTLEQKGFSSELPIFYGTFGSAMVWWSEYLLVEQEQLSLLEHSSCYSKNNVFFFLLMISIEPRGQRAALQIRSDLGSILRRRFVADRRRHEVRRSRTRHQKCRHGVLGPSHSAAQRFSPDSCESEKFCV